MEQELFAYWLYTLRGIGAKKRHELQQIYGNAEQIYYGDKTKLKESPVFSEQDKTLLGKPETVKEIKHKMQRMEQRGKARRFRRNYVIFQIRRMRCFTAECCRIPIDRRSLLLVDAIPVMKVERLQPDLADNWQKMALRS